MNKVKGSELIVKKTGRIDSLQGLRALAYIGIFINHTRLARLSCLGVWGVSVFLVLSGFLMMYSYLPRENEPAVSFAFAWNKIKKLYPLHIIMMLLSAFYAICLDKGVKATIINMITHTLLIQIWIPNEKFYKTLNGPAWYLCVSLFLYFCFPFVLKKFKKKMTKSRVIGLMAVLFGAEIVISIFTFLLGNNAEDAWFNTQWITYYCPPVRLIDFLMGCCIGYLFLNRKTHKKNYILETLTLILLILSWIVYRSEIGFLGSDYTKYALLYLPTTISLIWCVSSESGLASRVLSVKPLVWLGNLSPYTFLIHNVILKYCNVLAEKLFSYGNRLIISFVAFFLTIIAAEIWIKLYKYMIDLFNKKTL